MRHSAELQLKLLEKVMKFENSIKSKALSMDSFERLSTYQGPTENKTSQYECTLSDLQY